MKFYATDSETYGELVKPPRTDLPTDITIGQARSGRWWVQCTRTSGCTFYSSCLKTEAAAVDVARTHSNTHDRAHRAGRTTT